MTSPAAGPLVSRYAAVVCDLDGVVYRGPTALPGAVEALAALEVPVLYATNNASRPPVEVADHLRRLGLSCEPDAVATSSQAGAWLLSERVAAGSPVLAVGGDGVGLALREAGLRPVRPDEALEAGSLSAVLQGYGPQVCATDLAEAAYAIQAGALWVATNTDTTLPTDRGVAPGNGSLVGAVANAVGRAPDVVAGKPAPPLYLLCAERLGVDAESVLAVGDRLDTDIEGAVAAGIDSLLVLTGVDDLAACLHAPAHRRPTWVTPDLAALHLDPSVAAAGGASLVDIAAAVAAVHTAADAGADPSVVADLGEKAHHVLARATRR
ncbi:MAG TPA: HAD-IIA family hydrolase [Acidimicrobiales bacterium]|nr:HAD-IIA family hydrolase [Acidimicrobiales bacterium]